MKKESKLSNTNVNAFIEINTHLSWLGLMLRRRKNVCCIVFFHSLNFAVVVVVSELYVFIFAFNENSLSLLYESLRHLSKWALLVFCHISLTCVLYDEIAKINNLNEFFSQFTYFGVVGTVCFFLLVVGVLLLLMLLLLLFVAINI